MRIAFLFAMVLASSLLFYGKAAKAESENILVQENVDFKKCLAVAQDAITNFNVPANRIIAIVNTNIMWMTKIILDQENVIITCSAEDKKLVMTRSTPPDTHLIR